MDWTLLLGLTIPSVVVLLAVYFMFRLYFRHQMQVQLMERKKMQAGVTLPLRLQAFERLILLCERINLVDLVLRLKTEGSTARELQAALLLAIQQEFEHNLTQQLYVTDILWDVLKQAKSKTMDLIAIAAETLPKEASGDQLAQKIIQIASEEDSLPSQIAIKAIKTESGLWL